MLISTLILTAMLQSPLVQVDNSRAAFTKCLRQEVRKSLNAKTTPEDFSSSIKEKCAPTRATFRAALIAADQAAGDSVEVAAESADSQIEDYHSNFADKFKDYTETNTSPSE